MPRYLGKLTLLAALVLASFVLPSAMGGADGYPVERSAEAQAPPDWNAVDDFVYQLQDAGARPGGAQDEPRPRTGLS